MHVLLKLPLCEDEISHNFWGISCLNNGYFSKTCMKALYKLQQITLIKITLNDLDIWILFELN